jgi:hypothetical protein
VSTPSKSITAPNEIITPAGLTIDDPPPGLRDFLVGIQANESGFDYWRDQGSPGGSVGTYQGGAEEGFGAYQFTGPQSSQVEQAVKADWDPATQDSIAASMATGYYKEFGGASNPNIWADVTEAWYGPGTVGTAANDVLTNPSAPSDADWGNVKNALAGDAALPEQGWVFGPGYTKGLSTADVKAELAAPTSKATLDSWESDILGGLGGAAGLVAPAVGSAVAGAAGSAAESALGALLPSIGGIALKLTLTLGAAALVVLGLSLTTGKSAREMLPEMPSPSEAAAAAPELAAA